MGTERYFPGGKAAGRLADNSHPYSVEVKNCRTIYFHPTYVFISWNLIK
jgi:hypothetical protein